MNENTREGAFIPCGDSLERMQEIEETAMEGVSGGVDGEPKPEDVCSHGCEFMEDDFIDNGIPLSTSTN